MIRFPTLPIVAAATMLVLLAGGMAAAQAVPERVLLVQTQEKGSEQQPARRVVQIGGQGAYSYSSGGSPYDIISCLWQLQAPHVQKEIELVEEQKLKLKEIVENYAKWRREAFSGYSAGMSQEERQKMLAEYRQKMTKQAEVVRKQVEEVLLPHQLDTLKEIDFRTRAANVLMTPWMLNRLELSEQQKQKLRENRERLQEKIRKLQQESFEKSLKVLNAKQQEKLKEMHGRGFRP